MPHNHQESQGINDEENSGTSTGGEIGLNPLDGSDGIHTWLYQGLIDAQRFSDLFPNTAKDLRDGKNSTDLITKKIRQYLSRTIKIKMEDGFVGILSEFLAHSLTTLLIPDSFCRNSTEKLKLRSQLCTELQFIFSCTEVDENLFLDQCNTNLLFILFKQYYHTWKDQLDEMIFGGQTGMFRSSLTRPGGILHSQAAIEDIIRKVNQDFDICEEIYNAIGKYNDALIAIDMVAYNAERKECWECGKRVAGIAVQSRKILQYK
jgi:hypothetical protein